jgi:hypothetical protein
MALDALLPVGGELIMLYAGAPAAGAVSAEHATLLGTQLAPGTESYVILALAGALGYLLGALIGRTIGARDGRPLIERHGRWLTSAPRPSSMPSNGSRSSATAPSCSAALRRSRDPSSQSPPAHWAARSRHAPD